MMSNVKGAVVIAIIAAAAAAMLMMILTQGSVLAALGWAAFFALLQLPVIAAARNGHVDACSARLLRLFRGSMRQ
jgi:hypothetical protein